VLYVDLADAALWGCVQKGGRGYWWLGGRSVRSGGGGTRAGGWIRGVG